MAWKRPRVRIPYAPLAKLPVRQLQVDYAARAPSQGSHFGEPSVAKWLPKHATNASLRSQNLALGIDYWDASTRDYLHALKEATEAKTRGGAESRIPYLDLSLHIW